MKPSKLFSNFHVMETSRFLHLSLLLLILVIQLLLIRGDAAVTIVNQTDFESLCIATCLTENSISNFTLIPDPIRVHVDDLDFLYYKLLDFSIQNLRFAKSSVPKPAAIILPDSKEEVVRTVRCSRQCSLEIRVRCGGHSYEATSSVATDGSSFVVIDLMNLDNVSVDLESQVAWVEGGATLGQTYYFISQASKVLGFSAGSCPTVGIGGHIAGGGFGLLSRKYGLAADNVVDAILIDAKGRILDRKAMGEEVFWAIRGGGGGIFGIVYAWKIKLVEVPQVVTSFVVSRSSANQVPKLVYKWQHIAPMLPGNFYLSCFVGAGLPDATAAGISATFKGFYLGTKNEALSILSSVFPELRLKGDETKEMSWIESIVYFSGFDPTRRSIMHLLTDRLNPNKNFFKAKSDYVKTTLPKTGITSLIKILEKQPKGYVILDPYGGIMQNISTESIPFPHRKGNLFTIQYLVEWQEKDDGNSKEYINWIRGLYNSMTNYVSDSPRSAYINYMDLDLGEMEMIKLVMTGNNPSADAVEKARVWGEKYFLSNYDRLVHAKTLIDPYNIFKHQQGIPPFPIANVMEL